MAQGALLQPELCVFPGYSERLPVAGRREKTQASAGCIRRGSQLPHGQVGRPLYQMNAVSPVHTVAALVSMPLLLRSQQTLLIDYRATFCRAQAVSPSRHY